MAKDKFEIYTQQTTPGYPDRTVVLSKKNKLYNRTSMHRQSPMIDIARMTKKQALELGIRLIQAAK